MKFICTQEKIASGLSRVVSIAGRNTQLPVLQYVLVELKDGVMHLTCTDLEVGVHTIVQGKVEEDGKAIIPAKNFLDYIQQLPNDNPIEINYKDKVVSVKTKGFKANFPVGNSDDFPLLPEVEGGKEIEIDAGVFCGGLTRTVFAAARDETRPEIHSVFIKGSEDEIVLAATDSFRLAENKIVIKNKGVNFSFLLPLSTAQEVVRLFSGEDKITLIPQNNHILFKSVVTELSSRLVDGKYPDYEQIIPQEFKTSGLVSKEKLLQALKTLMVFLPRDSRRVKMIISPEKGSVSFSVGGESGEGDVDLSFEGEGDDLEVLFNIQYLIDGVQRVSGNNIYMRFVGSGEPAVLSPEGEKIDQVYVVMPIQG